MVVFQLLSQNQNQRNHNLPITTNASKATDEPIRTRSETRGLGQTLVSPHEEERKNAVCDENDQGETTK